MSAAEKKPDSANNNATRSIECELMIDAEPDAVWMAFTEGAHIGNWFAPEARSEPGQGGFIDLNWSPGNEEAVSHCVITEWQPQRRLVMSWRDAPGGEHPLPVEVVLEARDGGTLLRLTHSGFLSDASWDDEFDSHGRGWSYELRSLKYYLENQFGRPRTITSERFPMPAGLADWSGVIGSTGVFRVSGALGELAENVVGLPLGGESRAVLLTAFTDRDFAAVLDCLRGGVLRIAIESVVDQPELRVWTSSWQMGEPELRAATEVWYQQVRQLLNRA